MQIHSTTLEGVFVIDTTSFIDARGAFARLYCEYELEAVLGNRKIVQINHSCTHEKGAIRGLHFQYPPYAEMKFVRCLKGGVWDIAVDLRYNSPTFLKWYAEELTAKNQRMLVIPEGCAHGFQVLEKNSELLYLHTEFYQSNAEGGIFYDDPGLKINWPLPVTNVSAKDKNYQIIDNSFIGITL